MPNIRITRKQIEDMAEACARDGSMRERDKLLMSLMALAISPEMKECSRRSNEIFLLAASCAYRIVGSPPSDDPFSMSGYKRALEQQTTVLEGLLELVYVMAVFDEREANEQRNQPSTTGVVEQPIEGSAPQAG